MHRATKEARNTTEFLEKAYLETTEGLCMVSATQEITKGCWTERKVKRKGPALPGWKQEGSGFQDSFLTDLTQQSWILSLGRIAMFHTTIFRFYWNICLEIGSLQCLLACLVLENCSDLVVEQFQLKALTDWGSHHVTLFHVSPFNDSPFLKYKIGKATAVC